MNFRPFCVLLASLILIVVCELPADAQVVPLSNVSGTINPNNTLDHTYFIYAYSNGPLPTNIGVGFQPLGTLTGGTTNNYSFTSPVDPSKFLKYAIAGRYEISGVPTNVAVALKPTDDPTGQSWDTFFNTGTTNTQFNEPAVFTALGNDDSTLLSAFAAYTGPFHGIDLNSSGNIWNFSNGAGGGTILATVTAVPEPSSVMLLALGVMGLVAARTMRRVRS